MSVSLAVLCNIYAVYVSDFPCDFQQRADSEASATMSIRFWRLDAFDVLDVFDVLPEFGTPCNTWCKNNPTHPNPSDHRTAQEKQKFEIPGVVS